MNLRSLSLTACSTALAVFLFAGATQPALATGWHTCESEPKSDWISKEDLESRLTEQGWQVRRIKEDGNCWEVYAINAEGKRTEAYVNPITLEIEQMRTR